MLFGIFHRGAMVKSWASGILSSTLFLLGYIITHFMLVCLLLCNEDPCFEAGDYYQRGKACGSLLAVITASRLSMQYNGSLLCGLAGVSSTAYNLQLVLIALTILALSNL